MSELGWQGTKVRHADGRTGVIASDYVGFCHAGLSIRVDGGGEAFIQLNTNGPDTGEAGWEWWCENFDGGARWLTLGDHAAPPRAASDEE
jgi:hypothetical protein